MDIKAFIKEVHENAVNKGWWEGGAEGRNVGEIIALIHSEISEGFEAAMAGNPKSEKIPEFTEEEEELADIFIRICDFFGAMKVDVDAVGFEAATMVGYKENDYQHMHLYASRALECFRKDNKEGGYTNLFAILFVANAYGEKKGFKDGDASLRAKHEYNKTRPHKHGKAF